ncbi:MAG TPA: hypothetical protein VNS34_08935 [Rhizobiaceae bacterium]|nr:hypothetical protein [Rhizobiaceae bacterium]
MATIDFQERSIEKVVEHYVDSRTDDPRPISTTYALRAIRTVLPRCGLSDRQLSDMVAAFAIRKGRNVAFDL